ncbi:MAG: CAP domain-containing protein [Dethiobacteraceae bacterium]
MKKRVTALLLVLILVLMTGCKRQVSEPPELTDPTPTQEENLTADITEPQKEDPEAEQEESGEEPSSEKENNSHKEPEDKPKEKQEQPEKAKEEPGPKNEPKKPQKPSNPKQPPQEEKPEEETKPKEEPKPDSTPDPVPEETEPVEEPPIEDSEQLGFQLNPIAKTTDGLIHISGKTDIPILLKIVEEATGEVSKHSFDACRFDFQTHVVWYGKYKVTISAYENNKVGKTLHEQYVEKPTPNFSNYVQEVIRLTNKEREKRGLQPLKAHTKLSEVATVKAKDMHNNNYFAHHSPTYGSPFAMMKQFGVTYRIAAENIAAGQMTPQAVVNGWMNSEGHRENILTPELTHIGVGIFYGPKGYRTYWVQMFIGVE